MTRIRFDISAAMARWRARPQSPLRRFRMMDLQSLHEMTLGPGWFDSSWDLDQGLAVEVALPGDPTFRAWLEAQSRPSAVAAGKVERSLPADGSFEFEPTEWKTQTLPNRVNDPLPPDLAQGLDLSDLELVPPLFEPIHALALALV